jgi:type II secretory pathway component PulC
MIEAPSYLWIFRTSLLSLAITLFLGAGALVHLFRSNSRQYVPSTSLKATWPDVPKETFDFDGLVFKKSNLGSSLPPKGSVARRFRLAGTFFAVGLNQHSRKAILDDLQKKEQMLVSEGDLIDSESVIHAIRSDRVILRRGSMEEEILLCFTANPGTNGQQGAYSSASTADKSSIGLENRFGKRVGDKRWVLTRAALMDYYKEVLNNTDRLAKVYDSLKPVYQGNNIAGYTLIVEGEGDMFNAFGLQQGDVIRQVNSMPMTSQTKAEYFIAEFVKNRVNGFVIDIERSGKKEKLIYMIR